MTKVVKLYEQLTTRRAGTLSFKDFERLLLAFGFDLYRQRGSHRSYRHPLARRMMVIQPRGNDAKDYQVRQFLDMIEEYGLTIDER